MLDFIWQFATGCVVLLGAVTALGLSVLGISSTLEWFVHWNLRKRIFVENLVNKRIDEFYVNIDAHQLERKCARIQEQAKWLCEYQKNLEKEMREKRSDFIRRWYT